MDLDQDLNLRLVSAEFDESRIEVDDLDRVNGVLALRGNVDDDWRTAFADSAASDAPWELEDTALRFGPIPIEELADRIGALRDQIKTANESVRGRRYELEMAERVAEERRARTRDHALETLGRVFGRRLSGREG